MDTSGDGLSLRGQWPELRALAACGGPVASLYLTTQGDIENAAQVSLQRWRGLRHALAEQGADPAALELIDPLVASAHMHGSCLAVVASAESVWHVEHGPEPPPFDFAIWDSVPTLGPLIRWRQDAPPYLLVVTDRRGADITVVGRHSRPVERSVDGDDDLPLRKVAPGGWSQRRYQQRAENTWETHARQIAEQVQRASDEVDAEVIVVAGDVRAVELLKKHLPERLVRRVREISGGRAPDGSEHQIEEAAHRWVATAAARSTVALLERFREERGQGDQAADGVAATFQALNLGQVEVLLAHDDWHDDRRAWFGPDPIPVATDPRLLTDLGVAAPQSGRLFDVAVRAALATGAGIWVTPLAGGPTEGSEPSSAGGPSARPRRPETSRPSGTRPPRRLDRPNWARARPCVYAAGFLRHAHAVEDPVEDRLFISTQGRVHDDHGSCSHQER